MVKFEFRSGWPFLHVFQPYMAIFSKPFFTIGLKIGNFWYTWYASVFMQVLTIFGYFVIHIFFIEGWHLIYFYIMVRYKSYISYFFILLQRYNYNC